MKAIVQGLLIIRKCFQTVCGLMIFRPLETSRVGTQATPQTGTCVHFICLSPLLANTNACLRDSRI